MHGHQQKIEFREGFSMARCCEGVRWDGKTDPWTWHIGDP